MFKFGEGFTLSFHYYRTSTSIRRAPQRRETRPVRASPAQGDNRQAQGNNLACCFLVGTGGMHRAAARRPSLFAKGMETVKRGESLETARERANICTPRNLRCTVQPTDEPGLRPEPRTRPHVTCTRHPRRVSHAAHATPSAERSACPCSWRSSSSWVAST